MHRIALLFTAIVFILAGAASYFAARQGVDIIENSTNREVSSALIAAGHDWADIRPDGLQLGLYGLAPTEAKRFAAIDVIGQFLPPSRIIDKTTVLQSELILPPRFSLELLRNEDRVSLIGLIPTATGRSAILETVTSLSETDNVTDMLETAEHPVPPGWDDALQFGLESLQSLPRSKISVTPKQVSITAVSDTPAEQKSIEQVLASAKPDGVLLVLNITAPRPVITPFRFRMNIQDGVAELETCSADTKATRDKILAAAVKAGLTDKAVCEIGLGVPTTEWADAVIRSIQALATMNTGSLAFSDSEITLVANEDMPQLQFDAIVGNLEDTLPDLFSLDAILPTKSNALGESAEKNAPEFIATRSPEGVILLRGQVQNEMTRTAIDAYAASIFGQGSVFNQTRVNTNLPDGWPTRIFAGLEGLGKLHHGSLIVEPELVTVQGTSASPEIRTEISRILTVRIGGKGHYKIDVAFDERLFVSDEPPTGVECEKKINSILVERQIVFAPGSKSIENASLGVIDAIAEILRKCKTARFEVQGHTDSQGSNELNRTVSQARAEAVIEALLSKKILTSGLTAVGYGEELPIAENETAEGRALNRRIAFRLLKGSSQDDTN